eukprot:s7402_g1.t1
MHASFSRRFAKCVWVAPFHASGFPRLTSCSARRHLRGGIEAAGRADDPQKEAPCWRKRLSALRAALRCFAKVQGTDVLSQDSQDGSRFGGAEMAEQRSPPKPHRKPWQSGRSFENCVGGYQTALAWEAVCLGSHSQHAPVARWCGRDKRFMLLEALLPLGALAVYQATYEAAVLRNIEEGYAQSISVSGDVLVVGASAEGSGVVYVYSQSAGQWLQEARLVPSDAAVGDRFGSSLKLSGDYLVVGASGHDVNSLSETGSAYIFTRSSGWQQQAKLLANDTMAGDRFGVAVAVTEEGHVLVGADWHTGIGGPGSGAAYVFRCDDTGTGWSQEAKLTASDTVPFDRFGSAVAMSGSYVLASAEGKTPPKSCRAKDVSQWHFRHGGAVLNG